MQKPTRAPIIFSTINIAFVLFFVGAFAFLALTGTLIVEMAMETLELKLILADFVSPTDAQKLKNKIRFEPYCKSVRYVSQKEALNEFSHAGDDFMKAMDSVNPLPAIVHVRLHAAYINSDSIEALSKRFLETNEVVEIYYPVKLIEQVNENAERLQWIGLAVGGGLLLIAFFLILNTIRLAVFARRLAIRSMQLVGATAQYIRYPFLVLGVLQGFIGGTLAVGMLIGALVALNYYSELDLLPIIQSYDAVVMYVCLIILGTGIGWLSSWLAVNKYLHKRLDEIA